MSEDPLKKSVSVVIISIGIVVVAAAGVLLANFYGEVTDPGEFENVSVFDPSRYPAPAAGVPSESQYTKNCDNLIFSITKSGVRYVRQKGGSPFAAAERNNEFGYYRIEYGTLQPVDNNDLDRYDKAKLEYALYNCEGPFALSGTDF